MISVLFAPMICICEDSFSFCFRLLSTKLCKQAFSSQIKFSQGCCCCKLCKTLCDLSISFSKFPRQSLTATEQLTYSVSYSRSNMTALLKCHSGVCVCGYGLGWCFFWCVFYMFFVWLCFVLVFGFFCSCWGFLAFCFAPAC